MPPDVPAIAPAAPSAASRRRAALLVLAPFAVLLALHAAEPRGLVFDEVHYVPAADALARFSDDTNWEHPPLSKWIMGIGARALCASGVACRPAAHRLVAAAFGLWALATTLRLLLDLGFGLVAASCATALTAANVLWFVQSRTAMLDIFAVAFALAGLRRVRSAARGASPWFGWALLGLAMACKWSIAPICLLALLGSPASLRDRVLGVGVALLVYTLPFVPLALLDRNATPITGIVGYQLRMLAGHRHVDLSGHPYASFFWQWPTLLRPLWYHYEAGPGGDRYVWAGGNPLLYALALPATVWVAIRASRAGASTRERGLALLYWVPLAAWAALARPQIYYYFLPSSFWLGPAVVWMVLDGLFPSRPRAGIAVAIGLTVASVLLFAWFLPLLTGQLEPTGTYARAMWLRGWR